MIPSCLGPTPVSPVSSSSSSSRHDAAVRVVVWAGDNAAVPAFLGVDLNADAAASCSSISDCEDTSMMDQEDEDGNDQELECLISLAGDGEDIADDDDGHGLLFNNHDVNATEIFTPYPFDRQTKEEIENFRQLGLSFGDDWSLQFADEVTCSEEMSITNFGGGDSVVSPQQLPPQRTPLTNDGFATTFGLGESAEVKAMRNRLWKQSLKTSMFTSLQSCKR
jgi:hypothetical protein